MAPLKLGQRSAKKFPIRNNLCLVANKAFFNTFAGEQSKPKDLEESIDLSISLDPYERQGKSGEYIKSSIESLFHL